MIHCKNGLASFKKSLRFKRFFKNVPYALGLKSYISGAVVKFKTLMFVFLNGLYFILNQSKYSYSYNYKPNASLTLSATSSGSHGVQISSFSFIHHSAVSSASVSFSSMYINASSVIAVEVS